ncbi:MAG: DpnII family type II restriction endonuclease [Bacilli bacterium]
MKNITNILHLPSDDALFEYFIDNLKLKGITQWDYFVDWEKVFRNITPYEREFNLLNVLIGKKDIEKE